MTEFPRMTKFSIKGLLVFLTFIALGIALVLTQRELREKTTQLDSLLQESRYLKIVDDKMIHATNLPGFGQKSWRWRVYLPPDRQFRIRVAYDNVPANGIPDNSPDRMICELPAGESILTSNIVKENEKWFLALHSESNGVQNFDFTNDIKGTNTNWLSKRGGCSLHVAGDSLTEVESSNEPFVLLSLRNGLSPAPGVTAMNPNPTDGVVVWIEEIKPKQ